MNLALSRPLSRRTFLRGAGATLALPLLHAMTPARASAAAGAAARPPQRFAFIYTPNGYNQATFLPRQTGVHWTLPAALEPLAPVQSDVTLVTGLDRTYVGGTGVHAQCGACWLTSSPPVETLDGGFPTNITLDQVIAQELGRDTMLPSLELSCNDFADNKETKYFECISWVGPGYAANTEKNPRAVFRRLFGQPEAGPTRSVLDIVLAEARALHGRLGRDDQSKLDEYLTSVRATEQRIERAERASARRVAPPLAEPAGIPEKRGDYLRLMAEMFVLAFQQDLTRVATLVVDPERWDSPRMFHDVFDKPQNHHVLTHTKGDDAKAAITRIDRFHIEFYAHVVARMKSIREGDRTLLDSCVLTMGSGISDGDSHNYRDLQVLLAGGNLRRGHLRYDGDRPLADLWLTLARNAGAQRARFADSTGPLTELLA
jgi:hypothetical protein